MRFSSCFLFMFYILQYVGDCCKIELDDITKGKQIMQKNLAKVSAFSGRFFVQLQNRQRRFLNVMRMTCTTLSSNASRFSVNPTIECAQARFTPFSPFLPLVWFLFYTINMHLPFALENTNLCFLFSTPF